MARTKPLWLRLGQTTLALATILHAPLDARAGSRANAEPPGESSPETIPVQPPDKTPDDQPTPDRGTPAHDAPGASPSDHRSHARRVYQLRIEGDIDCGALVSKVRARLDEARDKKCGTFIVELGADRWRPDVVRDVAFLLRDSTLRTIVVLSDPKNHRVGGGALATALLAREAFVDRATSVAASPEQIANDMAPDDADVERATRELSGALHVRLLPLGVPSLAWMIAEPAHEPAEKPLFLVPAGGGGPASLAPSPPSPDARPVVKPAKEGVTLELSADDLAQLRLAAPVRGMSSIAAGTGTRLAPVTINASLDDARRHATDLLAEVDRASHAATGSLNLDIPRDPAVSRDAYQRAAAAAERELDASATALASLESLLAEYPELTRTPAPGQTIVAGKVSAYAARWKKEVQSRGDALAKLRAKAVSIAAQ